MQKFGEQEFNLYKLIKKCKKCCQYFQGIMYIILKEVVRIQFLSNHNNKNHTKKFHVFQLFLKILL